MTEIPSDLGLALPYFQHMYALKHSQEPVMAYFCGLYACQLAIQDADVKARHGAFIADSLDALDELKASLHGHPALQSDAASFAHALQQASRLFISADDEDKAGVASTSTVTAFATSAHFFQTCKLFKSPFPSELGERSRYARIRAIDIRRRLTSTTEQAPPADKLSPQEAAMKSPTYPKAITPAARSIASPVAKSSVEEQPKPAPVVLPSFQGTLGERSSSATSVTSPNEVQRLARAEKIARQAVSALQFEDAATARELLQKALDELCY